MPNVEIHGYKAKAAVEMKKKIRVALAESPDRSEIVTTIHLTEAQDLDGGKTAFLRVISSPREMPDLLTRLAPLNEDIEVIPLGQWIPKQKQGESQ